MSKPRSTAKIAPDDLSKALEICARSPLSNAIGRKKWRTDAWSEVIEFFGETKADLILETLEKMTSTFFSIKPTHAAGANLMHDAKTVRNDFLAACPSAPNQLVQSLVDEYFWLNR